MEKELNKFVEIVENPYSYLAEWKKESGRKVIGCFPMHIPEEIIHAAGMLPVTLLGSDDPITLADQYVHPYICQLVRGNFDLSLKGELDFLDGVVFSDFCLTVQMISDIWIHHKPSGFYHQLILPKNMRADYTQDYLTRQYLGLKTAMEKLSGKDISDSSLAKSISIYNENRILLHHLYQLRQANPGHFRARDIAVIVGAGMLMPKEEHSRLLSQFLEQAEKMSLPSDGKVRLVLSGYLCDMPELEVLDLLEELGAVISDDDFYVGRRYFHSLTDEGLSPITALAKHYIDDIPCPTKIDTKQDWSEYLAALVKDVKAEGIISIALKYCEPHLYDLPTLAANLSQKNIPNLFIETSHRGATGQLRTRFQAFLETL
jgi:benzoyl-CoA reductase subunit C